MFAGKTLGVLLALCTVLALSRGGPINATQPKVIGSLCEYKKMYCSYYHGVYCPECDADGNFIPWQCSSMSGYCWCVDVKTGEELPYTKRPLGSDPIDCEHYYHCPEGWTYYDEKCYKFVEYAKTWLEAEIYCQFEGGNLAAIHSYEQNHFVQDLIKEVTHSFPLTWIGGYDSIYPGYWMWRDGSKFHYEYWYQGSKPTTAYHCLMMNYHLELQWYSANCNDSLPFVCCKDM
ncbi:galactose-specific lectin nattectin-like [Stegastes partitus]|uniref:Galactose-specific lectin nattectin-like n=1 Tax=Stegastes partitus TaxID=144197 RepID=A0A3B4ZYZ4_9TELE|nr:PREDICTED: galactose-specific lectin nattectin-like [Stegastes partitus]